MMREVDNDFAERVQTRALRAGHRRADVSCLVSAVGVRLCRAGVIGAFPHVNARPSEQLDRWLSEIEADLRAYKDAHPGAKVAPHAVNLIVHRTNARYEPDLDIVVAHKVPLVITCLGDPRRAIEAVHGYGGLRVLRRGQCAARAQGDRGGADGLICVGGGAGGHASNQSAFSLVREVREFWDGCLVLGGSISDGHQNPRRRGTRRRSRLYGHALSGDARVRNAQDAYKQMIVDCGVKDIIYSDRFSGVFANFLLPSITRYGIDPETLPEEIPGHERACGFRGAHLERHLERGPRHRHHSRRAERRRARRPAGGRVSRRMRGAGEPGTGGLLMQHTFVIADVEHEALAIAPRRRLRAARR